MATIESLVNLKQSGHVYINGGMKRHGDEEEAWQIQTNLTQSEEGGTTCHSRDITSIASHDHPINSQWIKPNHILLAFPFLFLYEKPFHSDVHHSRVENTTETCFMPDEQVERIISKNVEAALEQSDLKMKNLMERIAEVNSEPQYNAKIKELDARAKKIKRRGDAVFAHIRKLRCLGVSHSPSPTLSPAPSQPQRCISPAEPIINIRRGSVNGDSFSDSASISSAVNDCVVSTLRRPKKGFWQSLQSTKEVVDLTEEDQEARLKEESLVTQQPNKKLVPSKPSSMPPKAIKEERVLEEHRVSSLVQLEKESWHSKLHPFPETPFPMELPVVAASHNLPQKPVVKLARIGSAQELGIAWNVDRKDPQAPEMDCYYIYVSHEHKNGTFSEWKCLGGIKATPLPMACKVSDCKGDKRLCFIVVGKDIFGRYGLYSDVHTVAPGQI